MIYHRGVDWACFFIRAPDSASPSAEFSCATRVAMRHHFCWLPKIPQPAVGSARRAWTRGSFGMCCVTSVATHSETILVTGIILAALVSS